MTQEQLLRKINRLRLEHAKSDSIISENNRITGIYSNYIQNLKIARKGVYCFGTNYSQNENDKLVYFCFKHNTEDMVRLSRNERVENNNSFCIPLCNLSNSTKEYIIKAFNSIKVVDIIIKDLDKKITEINHQSHKLSCEVSKLNVEEQSLTKNIKPAIS